MLRRLIEMTAISVWWLLFLCETTRGFAPISVLRSSGCCHDFIPTHLHGRSSRNSRHGGDNGSGAVSKNNGNSNINSNNSNEDFTPETMEAQLEKKWASTPLLHNMEEEAPSLPSMMLDTTIQSLTPDEPFTAPMVIDKSNVETTSFNSAAPPMQSLLSFPQMTNTMSNSNSASPVTSSSSTKTTTMATASVATLTMATVVSESTNASPQLQQTTPPTLPTEYPPPLQLPGSNSASWSTLLLNFLDDVEPLGSFCTAGIIESMPFPYPIVTVEGVGRLSFPIMEVAVKPIKAVATLSSYNKVTEADPAKVKLGGGAAWDECLQAIVVQACRELGFSSERIADLGIYAYFYKLLLYDSGGYATTQRDTPKQDGQFGTLVIQLPSKFASGPLTIRQNGQARVVDIAAQAEDKFQYIASYTDCEHSLATVTSGNRLCLVFNLVATRPVRTGMPVKFSRGLSLPKNSASSNGGLPFVHPSITIERVPNLSLPASSLSMDGSAPFVVRMNGGDEWDTCLHRIVHQACRLLGFTDERFENLGIRADLKQMLLYQNWEQIAASQSGGGNKDASSASGLFGKLVVQVPSKSSEGEVTVEHQGLSKRFKLLSTDRVAPSIDLPLVMVFDLVRPSRTQIPAHSHNLFTEAQLQALVAEWRNQPVGNRLGYQLGYQYKPGNFDIAALKGHDSVVFQTVTSAKTPTGAPLFDVHLLLMERYIKKSVDKLVEDDTRARKVLDANGRPVDPQGWTMFQRSDGWLVNKEEFCGLDENLDGTGECQDDEGNPIGENHKMFHGINEERIELDWDNAASSKEQWYYAAAIVVSPAAVEAL
jgi:hypothetical protein